MGKPLSMKTSSSKPRKTTSSKKSKLLIVVPESSNLTAEDEQKRLSYLKKVIVPALWAHQSAAFLREVSVVKPKEFSVDLLTIQTKLNKNKYVTSLDAFKDLKTLFESSQKSRTSDIKKAGMTLLDHYNDKMRGFEKRCSDRIENKSDPTSNGTTMELDKQKEGQACSICAFVNTKTATNCATCGNDLSCGNNSSTQPSDAAPPQNPILSSPAVWNCPECTFTNSPQQMVCEICNTPKNILDMLKKEIDQCHDKISEISKLKEVSEVSYPSNWSETLSNDKGDLRMIELKNTDLDYTFVADWAEGKLNQLQFKLKGVRRVENWEMYQVYAQKRIAMERKNGTTIKNEQWLFHGTSEDSIDGICRYGFNRSYAGKNGTAFGRGVYFSSEFITSAAFSRMNSSGLHKMLLCRVLTGYYSQGHPNLIEAPLKSQTEKVDSVVNILYTPTTYVIFTDYQAYPTFEISYSY